MSQTFKLVACFYCSDNFGFNSPCLSNAGKLKNDELHHGSLIVG